MVHHSQLAGSSEITKQCKCRTTRLPAVVHSRKDWGSPVACKLLPDNPPTFTRYWIVTTVLLASPAIDPPTPSRFSRASQTAGTLGGRKAGDSTKFLTAATCQTKRTSRLPYGKVNSRLVLMDGGFAPALSTYNRRDRYQVPNLQLFCVAAKLILLRGSGFGFYPRFIPL